MNQPKLAVVLLLLFMLSGCLSTQATISSPTTSLHLPSALPTHTAATPTFVPSPSPTSTPIPTVVPTPVPTLPVEVARAKLLEMLGNNSNCRLPCLWGIKPGESTNQEAQATLSPLSSLSGWMGFGPDSGFIDSVYTDGDLETYINIDFAVSPENDIVTNIAFQGRALRKSSDKSSDIFYYDVFDSKLFREHMRKYMLPQILSEQGIPTSVKIYTSGSKTKNGPIGGFHILLLYPDQGFLVHYTTQMKIVGANVRGCPASAYVELELYPAGNGVSFIKSLNQWWQDIISDYYKPIETVTSMSQEKFYETFRQPTDKCIDTPAKLWPTPDVGAE